VAVVNSIQEQNPTVRLGAGESDSAGSAACEVREGLQVGRYWLRRELGAGGMGVVYEAYDPELERPVALKLLRSSLDRQRLSREARALAKLSHPNVVAVYDVGAFGEQAFIAMELVEGSTLRRWASDRQRSVEELVRIALQAGRGLAAAHAAGLLHRDFKPDNVIVGRDGRVRVLDFGVVSDLATRTAIAAAMDGNEEFSSDLEALLDEAGRLTAAGTLIGTPAYMAPEQFRGDGSAPTADQFSFCVVLWELVYGARPFSAKSLLELARGGDIALIKALDAGRTAPSWLRRCLERGLTIDCAGRYPSMAALLEALEAGLTRQMAEHRLLGRRYEPLPAAPLATAPGSKRALDRFTGRLVSIRRVDLTPTATEAVELKREQLARRFRKLAGLRHPNLVNVLDLRFDRSSAPYWVLEGSEAGTDLLTAVRQPGSATVLEYLVQLLRALGHLHDHGVFIGALDASALVIAGDRLKLVPLGSAHTPAPASAAPSLTGDLRAFASFALEQLTQHAELDERLAPVFARLQQVESAANYRSADDVVRALDAAVGGGLGGETFELRESRLLGAPLLGREHELHELEAALGEACAGRGSAWLLSGESGAGKSRLLDELETLGIVHGAVVLRGQAEREGRSAYRLFRDVLHGLSLLTDVDEFEASVLLPVVPNLGELLGRDLAPVPELDAPSIRARFIEVIESMLRRQQGPLVILLEDLQWAKGDSLDLLQRLVGSTSSLPLLVVASARDDEPLPCRDALATMRSLPIARLPGPVIAELARAMVGEQAARPDLIDLLERETEGNAFFLVEMVRALADQSGGFERIGHMPLPEKIFAGGIDGLIRQRLRSVSGEARQVLRVAAIMGRQLEPKLLQGLAAVSDLNACLDKCVDAAILERSGDRLRFRHDKLREGVLTSLSAAERASLHARVVGELEKRYPGDRQRFAALAYHSGQAGLPEKEARYAALAGEDALMNGAVREAIELLERARNAVVGERDPLALSRVCIALANAHYFATEMQEAISSAALASRTVGMALPVAPPSRIATLIAQLCLHLAYRAIPGLAQRGHAARGAANREAARAADCMAKISISTGDALGVLLFSLLAWNRAARAGFQDARASGMLGYALASLGFPNLARSYFAPTRDGAWMSDRAYPVVKTSFFLGIGELSKAEQLSREELELARRMGFKSAEAFSSFLLGYCAFYRGRLQHAQESFELAVAVHAGTRANFAPVLAHLHCSQGHLHEAEALLQASLAPSNPKAPQSIAFAVLASIQARNGNTEAALASAERAVALAGRGTTFGYAGAPYFSCIFEIYLSQAARQERRARAHALRQLSRVARHCRVWARAFRVGEPLLLLYEGKLAALRGRPLQAARLWRESRQLAEQMGLGHYVTLAGRALDGTASEPEPVRRARAKSAT